MDIAIIIAIIRSCVVFITFPIYFVLLATFVKHRRVYYSSSFYILFTSASCADILHVVFMRVIFDFIPAFVVGYEPYWNSTLLSTMNQFALFYIAYVQIIGIVVISINRLTAIAVPLRHETIWSTRCVLAALLVQWILPLAWIIPMFFSCCQSVYFEGGVFPVFENGTVGQLYAALDSLIGNGFLILTLLIVNVFTVARMRSYQRKLSRSPNATNGQNNRSELRLACIGIVLASSAALATIPQLLYYCQLFNLIRDIPFSEALLVYWCYCFYDIFTLSSPYLLLVLCASLRKHVFSLFRFKNSLKVTSVEPIVKNSGIRSFANTKF